MSYITDNEFKIGDLLKLFADQKGHRTFDKPWVENGFIYATNGHILIRIDCKYLPHYQYIMDNPPNVKALINRRNDRGEWEPVDVQEIKDILATHTPTCSLDGKEIIECTECQGIGHKTCTCPECEDEHEIECPECEGYGKLAREDTYAWTFEAHKAMPFRDQLVSWLYLSHVKEAMSWRYWEANGVVTRLTHYSLSISNMTTRHTLWLCR